MNCADPLLQEKGNARIIHNSDALHFDLPVLVEYTLDKCLYSALNAAIQNFDL